MKCYENVLSLIQRQRVQVCLFVDLDQSILRTSNKLLYFDICPDDTLVIIQSQVNIDLISVAFFSIFLLFLLINC